MPTILPIAWTDKVNNPELLALLQQYSENEYLTAEEINLVKDTINALINSNPSNFDMADYRQKLEKAESYIYGTGETTVPELLSASYRIMDGFTEITGIAFGYLNYAGREYTFVNFQSTPITIVHGITADGVLHFDLLNAADIVLTKGQMVKFKYCKRDGQSVLELVSKNFSISAPTIYNLASPTTIAVGGLPANSNILGQSFSEIIEAIVSPYVLPAFTGFTMTGQATPVESGTKILGLKSFAFGFSQAGNVLADSLEIIDGVISIGANLPIVSPQVIEVGSFVISGNGTSRVYSAKAKNTNNTVFVSGNFTIISRFLQFFGNVTTHPTTSLLVRALPENNFANINTFTKLISSTKYTIAIPATKALVSVITANNENITSGFVVSNFDVNDANGLAVPYKIYNFTSAIPLNINATITLQ